MKDRIDERNKREKMEKSIIKYWNVRYSPARAGQDERQADRADGAAYGMEQAAGAKVSEEMLENPQSGYGALREEDEETRGKIDKILHEKSDVIRDIVENKGQMS